SGDATGGENAARSAAEGTRAGMGVGAHARDASGRSPAAGETVTPGVARGKRRSGDRARAQRFGPATPARDVHGGSECAAGGPDCDGDGASRRRRAGRGGDEFPRDEGANRGRSEEHTSELQSRVDLVCRLLLEKKKNENKMNKLAKAVNASESCKQTA